MPRFVIHPQSDLTRGQVQFYHKLYVYLFEKENSSCIQEFPETRKKEKISITTLKAFAISPKPNQTTLQIQTDDIVIEFSKNFTEYIRIRRDQKSQRANSISTNNVFSIVFSYISILQLQETQNKSPLQTYRHSTVIQSIYLLTKFLDKIRGNYTGTDTSQNVKDDLQRTLAWFVINLC